MFGRVALSLFVVLSFFAGSEFLAAETKASSATEANTLTAEEEKAGWQLLFDGKSMDAWRNYKRDKVSDGWKVEEGVVKRLGRAGDMITKEQFENFELTLDYKISKAGNSGLMYHVSEEGRTPWMTGPEVQIQDNKDGHDPEKSGWLYQLYPAKEDATHPAGEWNTLRIVITGDLSEHYMNGVKYCQYVKGSEDWNARVAKSKFGRMQGFGKSSKGHICLQDHGDLVEFRNIKVRVIQ